MRRWMIVGGLGRGMPVTGRSRAAWHPQPSPRFGPAHR
jgi:hypothetical protein